RHEAAWSDERAAKADMPGARAIRVLARYPVLSRPLRFRPLRRCFARLGALARSPVFSARQARMFPNRGWAKWRPPPPARNISRGQTDMQPRRRCVAASRGTSALLGEHGPRREPDQYAWRGQASGGLLRLGSRSFG